MILFIIIIRSYVIRFHLVSIFQQDIPNLFTGRGGKYHGNTKSHGIYLKERLSRDNIILGRGIIVLSCALLKTVDLDIMKCFSKESINICMRNCRERSNLGLRHFCTLPQVIMGGGRRNMLPKTMRDEEESKNGYRRDGRNLINEWREDKERRGGHTRYVWNRDELLKTNFSDVDFLLGIGKVKIHQNTI